MYEDAFQATNKTASAGTEITVVVPGFGVGSPRRRRLTTVQYRAAATAHTLSLLRPAANVTLTAAADAAATELVVSSASRLDGNIASGDYLVFRDANGTWHVRKASGLSTLTVTVPAISTALAADTVVWLMGAVGTAHNASLPCTASVVNLYHDGLGGVFQGGFDVFATAARYKRSGAGDPLLLVSSNGTNAGNFELVTAVDLMG